MSEPAHSHSPDLPQPAPVSGSAEDRKAASALAALDSTSLQDASPSAAPAPSTADASAIRDALARLEGKPSGGGKTAAAVTANQPAVSVPVVVKNVKVDQADVALLVSEGEMRAEMKTGRDEKREFVARVWTSLADLRAYSYRLISSTSPRPKPPICLSCMAAMQSRRLDPILLRPCRDQLIGNPAAGSRTTSHHPCTHIHIHIHIHTYINIYSCPSHQYRIRKTNNTNWSGCMYVCTYVRPFIRILRP